MNKREKPFFRIITLILSLSLFISYQSTANEVSTDQPEEEDYNGSPYTNYGEFGERQEEEESILFFQYGRFYGVGLGVGTQGVTGNRGLLWEGGFPVFDFKIHYWFDFNFALQMGVYLANHSYYDGMLKDTVGVSVNRIGIDVKYYFDVRDTAAPISFANPFIILGGGSFTKTEISESFTDEPGADSVFGVSVGGGLEFALKPKKVYMVVEGKFHLVSFADSISNRFEPEIPNLSGYLYTTVLSIMFTW